MYFGDLLLFICNKCRKLPMVAGTFMLFHLETVFLF